MGEKPEVLDAVLKETVDLVMDLTLYKHNSVFLLIFVGDFNGFSFIILFVCVVIVGEHTH